MTPTFKPRINQPKKKLFKGKSKQEKSLIKSPKTEFLFPQSTPDKLPVPIEKIQISSPKTLAKIPIKKKEILIEETECSSENIPDILDDLKKLLNKNAPQTPQVPKNPNSILTKFI